MRSVTQQTDTGSLRLSALVDPRTGLAIESLLRDHLRRSLAVAARDERFVGVLWLIISRGLPELVHRRVPDRVVRQCAQRVSRGIRGNDLAAAFDENTIVVGLTAMNAPSDASIAGARLMIALARPISVEDRNQSVHFACGVAPASDRSISVDGLLAHGRIAAVEAAAAGEPLRIYGG